MIEFSLTFLSFFCKLFKFYSILKKYICVEYYFLCHYRRKLEEDLTTIKYSIAEKQGEWHKKWKEFLGLSPFGLIKGWTPVSNTTCLLETTLI